MNRDHTVAYLSLVVMLLLVPTGSVAATAIILCIGIITGMDDELWSPR
ncbi:MAG: hypothetical protein ACOYOJ_21205 [Alsobacter sp.]